MTFAEAVLLVLHALLGFGAVVFKISTVCQQQEDSKLVNGHMFLCLAGKTVTFSVKNTGHHPGAEAAASVRAEHAFRRRARYLQVAQLYLDFPPSAGEPFQLKGSRADKGPQATAGCPGPGRYLTLLPEVLQRRSCHWIALSMICCC